MSQRLNHGLRLTDKALAALGTQPSRLVPLMAVPWRDDAKDRRRPTVAEMEGLFAGGPESVGWLREQRGGGS